MPPNIRTGGFLFDINKWQVDSQLSFSGTMCLSGRRLVLHFLQINRHMKHYYNKMKQFASISFMQET